MNGHCHATAVVMELKIAQGKLWRDPRQASDAPLSHSRTFAFSIQTCRFRQGSCCREATRFGPTCTTVFSCTSVAPPPQRKSPALFACERVSERPTQPPSRPSLALSTSTVTDASFPLLFCAMRAQSSVSYVRLKRVVNPLSFVASLKVVCCPSGREIRLRKKFT